MEETEAWASIETGPSRDRPVSLSAPHPIPVGPVHHCSEAHALGILEQAST